MPTALRRGPGRPKGALNKPRNLPSVDVSDINQEFLRELDTARLALCSVKTLRRWHKDKIGPPRITFGRTVLYRRSALIAWLLQHEK